MTLDLAQAQAYSQTCHALSAALLDRDWFETGSLLTEFVDNSGRWISGDQVCLIMLATGQCATPTPSRIRQSRSAYLHFVASGLTRRDARGISLETARLLCQHHRQGRLTDPEFHQAVLGLQRSYRAFGTKAPARNIRTPQGARELLDFV